MKQKTLVFFLFVGSLMALNAQSKDDILIHQTFSANIGSICEETPDDNPCEGLQVYLVLHFTKDRVTIIEKEVSTCGEEYMNSELEYKWAITKDSEIKLETNSNDREHYFLKDLVLKIEEEKVIGYKRRRNKKTDKFKFEIIDVK